jgi:uncharacterized protein (TIGR00725 family)
VSENVTHGVRTAHRTIVGVMGPGAGASDENLRDARRLGELVARAGWVVLNGGHNLGVMHAVSEGAHEAGGLVVGILSGNTTDAASPWLDVAIVTGMGQARNNVNVLSSHVVVACGMSQGTASEVALALRNGKAVVLLGVGDRARDFFTALGGAAVHTAGTPEDAVEIVRGLLNERGY